jgi:hypothetical protein
MKPGKSRVHHIRGVLINGVTGQPLSGVQVVAGPRQQTAYVMKSTAVTDAAGAFDLPGLAAGSYIVFSNYVPARPDARQGVTTPATVQPELLVVYTAVELGEKDLENLRLIATTSPNVTGRIVIEGRPQNNNDPDLPKVQIMITRDHSILGMQPGTNALSGVEGTATMAPDGSFTFQRSAGDYRIKLNRMPVNTYLKSMRMGSEDIAADGLHVTGPVTSPMEIVLGSDGGELLGVAMNDQRGVVTNAIVVLVPDSPILRKRSDLYRTVTTDASGRFRIQTIAPGEYKLFAWEYTDPDSWQDAEFMQAYEAFGKPILITQNSRQEAQINPIPARK